MAENSLLRGLNAVQSTTNSHSRDSIDSVEAPNLDDLWATMGFTTQEPFFSAERDTASRSRHKKTSSSISRDGGKERKASSSFASAPVSTDQPGLGLLTDTDNIDAIHDPLVSLSNLFALQQQTSGRFTPFLYPWPTAGSTSNGSSGSNHQATDFDSFLSGFPVDPFLVPPSAVAGFVQPFGAAPPPSLRPLTIRGNEGPSPRTPTSSTGGGIFAIDPTLALAPLVPVPASTPPAPTPTKLSRTAAPPPAKRQKTSTAAAATTTANTNAHATTKETSASSASPITMSPVDEDEDQFQHAPRQMSPLTAAEDKRRRNTAASARFRAKKKEREAAMERRAKNLEDRVTELERECESLRKENGWLKGLVIGAATGDGVDLTGLEGMFNAFKAAVATPSVVPAPAALNEEKIASKRKRPTA